MTTVLGDHCKVAEPKDERFISRPMLVSFWGIVGDAAESGSQIPTWPAFQISILKFDVHEELLCQSRSMLFSFILRAVRERERESESGGGLW